MWAARPLFYPGRTILCLFFLPSRRFLACFCGQRTAFRVFGYCENIVIMIITIIIISITISITSREVMRQGGLILAAGRVRWKKKTSEKKTQKNPPHPKHTTKFKFTAARRPRPTRDGARRNTSHSLAHTRQLPWIPGLWKSASYSSRNQ